MKVTVFYDYICPFCYITSTNIEALSEEFDLDIDWKGIEIHPEYQSGGVKSSKTLRSLKASEIIKQTAGESGIPIILPGFRTNSRLSLEASEFAKTRNLFKAMHKALYNAYFQDKKNIGRLNIILELGETAGIDRILLEECLIGRSMFEQIEVNKKEAAEYGVLGVPTVILGNFPIHGNQTIDTLRHIIRRAIERS
jgi:predicted DsbA family dithiol-disulfide isomerase